MNPYSTLIQELVVFLLIPLIPIFFYIRTLDRVLRTCSRECRAMQPGLLKLMLVPVLNVFWHLYVVIKVSDSLEAEMAKRKRFIRTGRALGLTTCILTIASFFSFMSFVLMAPFPSKVSVGTLTAYAALASWIFYWVVVSGTSKRLELAPME